MNGITTYKIQKSHFIDRGFPRIFITLEELTAEILQAEKKAYGKVIRMMAHEVNNTIGPVNSILDTTLKTNALTGNEPLKNALELPFKEITALTASCETSLTLSGSHNQTRSRLTFILYFKTLSPL